MKAFSLQYRSRRNLSSVILHSSGSGSGDREPRKYTHHRFQASSVSKSWLTVVLWPTSKFSAGLHDHQLLPEWVPVKCFSSSFDIFDRGSELLWHFDLWLRTLWRSLRLDASKITWQSAEVFSPGKNSSYELCCMEAVNGRPVALPLTVCSCSSTSQWCYYLIGVLDLQIKWEQNAEAL